MDTGGTFTAHRERAEALRERYSFAAEVMQLYLALVEVWTEAAHADPPEPAKLAAWATDHVLPSVIRATTAAGPLPLAESVRAAEATEDLSDALAGWLAGAQLPPVPRYLARASTWPTLVGWDEAGVACSEDPAPRGGRTCPRCGGWPQLAVRGRPGEALVTGGRSLMCSRCGLLWPYSSSSCASCGETTGAARTVYAEQHPGPVVERPAGDDAPTFPHLRIDSCASCQRYLIDVDLAGDPDTVPEVDEIAALPLHLYAADLGLSRITPNLMGF
jgi:hypothetical protein